jgi:hypothetical protein
MKKVFLTAGIIMMAATVTFAHTAINHKDRKETRIERKKNRRELRRERRAENPGEVSVLTKDNFVTDFPDAKNARFIRTKNFDEVAFMSGKERLRAYYDNSSNLIGTTQKKSFEDLPEKAQKEILKQYPDYSIDSVIKFDDNESNETDMIMYGTTFDDADNYFVELKNDSKAIVVKVGLSGEVSFFKDLK